LFNDFYGQIEDKSVINVVPLKRFPWKQLQSRITILWNGDVVTCRQDFDGKYVLGNLKNQSFENILAYEKLEEIWKAQKNGKYNELHLCKNCNEWFYNPYV
jgi:radical SAM protein with 4Fe4S-binding SPASM domain